MGFEGCPEERPQGCDSGCLFCDVRIQVGRGKVLDFDMANGASIFVLREITGKAPSRSTQQGKSTLGWGSSRSRPTSGSGALACCVPRKPRPGPLPLAPPRRFKNRARRGKGKRKRAGGKTTPTGHSYLGETTIQGIKSPLGRGQGSKITQAVQPGVANLAVAFRV